jgi:hypothetical protein
MLAILPVALALQMQLSQREVEHALVDGVREKLAAGWSIADVRGDDDEHVFTLTRGVAMERHIAHVDYDEGSRSGVRIESGRAPRDLRDFRAPSPFLVDAIKSGGVEIVSNCGSVDARPYLIDANVKGAAARKLVAETLRSSDDLEQASVDDDEALFGIERGGKFAVLHVGLADGKVVRAELRRYEYGPDMTTHTEQAKMKRHIGPSVQSIEGGERGPVLVGTGKKFEIDTATFESNFPDDHTCGC